MEENIVYEYLFIARLWRKIFNKNVIQIQCFETENCKDMFFSSKGYVGKGREGGGGPPEMNG